MGLYTSLGKLPVWFEGNYKTTEKDRVRDLMIKGKIEDAMVCKYVK